MLYRYKKNSFHGLIQSRYGVSNSSNWIGKLFTSEIKNPVCVFYCLYDKTHDRVFLSTFGVLPSHSTCTTLQKRACHLFGNLIPALLLMLKSFDRIHIKNLTKENVINSGFCHKLIQNVRVWFNAEFWVVVLFVFHYSTWHSHSKWNLKWCDSNISVLLSLFSLTDLHNGIYFPCYLACWY